MNNEEIREIIIKLTGEKGLKLFFSNFGGLVNEDDFNKTFTMREAKDILSVLSNGEGLEIVVSEKKDYFVKFIKKVRKLSFQKTNKYQDYILEQSSNGYEESLFQDCFEIIQERFYLSPTENPEKFEKIKKNLLKVFIPRYINKSFNEDSILVFEDKLKAENIIKTYLAQFNL